MITLTEQAVAGVPEVGRRQRLLAPAILTAAGIPAAIYLYRMNPYEPGHYPTCIFRALTGWYCPGCGLTRATHDLLHLDVASAFDRNPLAPFLALFFIYLTARWMLSKWRGTTLTWEPKPWLSGAMFIGFLVFTVLRNLPGMDILSPA